MRKLIALALVAAAAPMFADDGNSATATATATVTIYAPVGLECDGTKLDLGKLVMLKTGQTASVTFGGGQILTRVNCVDFSGPNSGTAGTSFPTFTLTKDTSLGVSFSTTCSNNDLTLETPASVTDGSTTAQFQLAGTWTFSDPGKKDATITVTASYI